MFFIILVIIILVLAVWLLMFFRRAKRPAWMETEYREAQPFVFSIDKTFTRSRNKEELFYEKSGAPGYETRPFKIIKPETKPPEIKKSEAQQPASTKAIKPAEIKPQELKPRIEIPEKEKQATVEQKPPVKKKPQAVKQAPLVKESISDLPLETIIIPADKEDNEIDFDHLKTLIDDFFGDGIDLEDSK